MNDVFKILVKKQNQGAKVTNGLRNLSQRPHKLIDEDNMTIKKIRNLDN